MYNKSKPGNTILSFKLIICTGIFLFNIHTSSFAQQNPAYIFRHIDLPDGLLHTEVGSIVQDGKGYIWILSPNGLQRYDGSRFVNYPYTANNPDGVIDCRHANLFYDKKNDCIWISNMQLQKFDLQKNRFVRVVPEKMITDDEFQLLDYTDSSGTHWHAGNFGFLTDDADNKKIFPYFFSAPFLSPAKSDVFFEDTEKGELWLVNYWNGLMLFDKKTKQVYTHSYNQINHPLLQAMDMVRLMSIMKDSEGNIWVSNNENYFYRYDPHSKKLSTYSSSAISGSITANSKQGANFIVRCFFEDDHHTLWIGTENAGLLKYNRQADSFTVIINADKNKNGLLYNFAILTIFQDREKNIWLGTDKGISIFDPYWRNLRFVRHEEGIATSLPKFEINSIIQAVNGDILAGTFGGGITLFDSSWHFKKNIRFPGPYEYNLVWSFIQQDDGSIWAGCQHGYIHIYDPLTGSLRTIHPKELSGSTIWSMAKDKKGNILFGLHNGKIATWNKQENRFYPYNDSIRGLTQTFWHVQNIFFDNKQHCWVSTEVGLKEFDTEKRIYSAVHTPDINNPQSISANNITGIEQYNDSMLVIGTLYGGLNFFNFLTNKFSHLTVNEGLPSNSVYSVKKDSADYFWFTTDYGLYKFKPGAKNFIPFAIEPGIINSAFKAIGFYPFQNGKWNTVTSSEIINFDPQNKRYQSNAAASVEITSLNVFDNPVFIDSLLSLNKPIRLGYKQNFLTIEFGLLKFSHLQQTRYEYKLSGINNDWVNAGTKNFANYTNLEPGEYTFSVRAGDESEPVKVTSFIVIITPPFWKTGWFILLTIFCIIFLIYQLIKWRIKNIRAVAEEKLKVQQLNAEQYKNKLELEQIINYFSSSLIDKNTVDDVLWDVAKNLISHLGFVDCMMYLWNDDKTKMIQRAGYGPKGSIEEITKHVFDVSYGEGVVGYVMQTKEQVLIPDTSKDFRYRVDEMERLSEITVPVIYNDELIGVIDSEHHEKHFYTQRHVQLLSTIAALTANKIKSIESERSLRQTKMEMLGINEKLSAAKLEALQSQLNPHFIFNCLNSIDNLIQNDEKEKATLYLAKFAKLIRSILETSKNNTVPCWKDMETLKVYLELEEFRCDKKFSYQVNISNEIFNGDYKVPPLVIQPFVENAIHHGLLNKIATGGKLIIDVSVTQTHIHYTIQDNGVGRAKAEMYKQINKPAHKSMGMQITTDRINLFNQNNNGSVTIIDLYDEQHQSDGTRVEVRLINQP